MRLLAVAFAAAVASLSGCRRDRPPAAPQPGVSYEAYITEAARLDAEATREDEAADDECGAYGDGEHSRSRRAVTTGRFERKGVEAERRGVANVMVCGELVEQARQVVLEGHGNSLRILLSARALRDLTVPGRQPRCAAISASVSPSQYRRTTTARSS